MELLRVDVLYVIAFVFDEKSVIISTSARTIVALVK
jgi:hypothetical protein